MSDKANEGLRPPAGAEPGSVWMVSWRGGRRWLAEWTGAAWADPVTEATWTPLELADRGYTLDAPHGLDAAHRVMIEAGMTMPTLAQERAGHWHVAGSVDRDRSFFGTGPSALAAALDAVRAMREVGG